MSILAFANDPIKNGNSDVVTITIKADKIEVNGIVKKEHKIILPTTKSSTGLREGTCNIKIDDDAAICGISDVIFNECAENHNYGGVLRAACENEMKVTLGGITAIGNIRIEGISCEFATCLTDTDPVQAFDIY
ncbi:MAG: hypothetical protein LBS20_21105 [Prevotella sp.]|jgi:hypothetical protein|nr:hypothetical protein [Prevotella sp.]